MGYMTTQHRLFLGSQSPSRQMLLRDAHIPFTLVLQNADERSCGWTLPLEQLVATITILKMKSVILPLGQAGNEVCFVLTADTLAQDTDGTLHGKPESRNDAITKIRSARQGSRVATAFCLDRRIWRQGVWDVERRIEQVVTAEYIFNIPDRWIETYFENSIALQTAGAIAAEGFGAQFMKIVHGSCTTIIGLPMYEVREALETLGFWG